MNGRGAIDMPWFSPAEGFYKPLHFSVLSINFEGKALDILSKGALKLSVLVCEKVNARILLISDSRFKNERRRTRYPLEENVTRLLPRAGKKCLKPEIGMAQTVLGNDIRKNKGAEDPDLQTGSRPMGNET